MKYNQPYGISDPNAQYINGNPAAGIQGSIPPAAAFEYHQRELVQLITQAGFVPDDGDLSQVTRAVRQGVNYFTAAGTANAITINPPLPVLAYKPGLKFNVKLLANNTGPATLQVGSLAAVQIVKPSGAVLAANDLVAGMVAGLIYDGASFQIENYGGTGGGPGSSFNVNIPYCVATGTANAITAPFSPAITVLADGNPFEIKVIADNTGPVTIACNALAPAPLLNIHGAPMVAGDIVAGEVILIIYLGGHFQLTNVSGNTRPVMKAPRIYYVNGTTGHDDGSFDGLSTATPFLTIQHALDVMSLWDNNGFSVTILVADGTYARAVLPRITGSGGCGIQGNLSLPQNCVISDTDPYSSGRGCLFAGGSCGSYSVSGFKFQSVNNNGLVVGGNGTQIGYYNCEFGPCGGQAHILIVSGNVARYSWGLTAPFTRISGSCAAHVFVQDGGVITVDAGPLHDLIVSAPITFGVYAQVTRLSVDNEYWHSIVGANNVTAGTKYAVSNNGVLTQAASCLGPTPGYVTTGGQAN